MPRTNLYYLIRYLTIDQSHAISKQVTSRKPGRSRPIQLLRMLSSPLSPGDPMLPWSPPTSSSNPKPQSNKEKTAFRLQVSHQTWGPWMGTATSGNTAMKGDPKDRHVELRKLPLTYLVVECAQRDWRIGKILAHTRLALASAPGSRLIPIRKNLEDGCE